MLRLTLSPPLRHLPRPFSLLFFFLLFLSLPFATTTTFTIDVAIDQNLGSTAIPLSRNIQDYVFGLTPKGSLEATLTTVESDEIPLTFVVCEANSTFVRSSSLERRHPGIPLDSIFESIAEVQCAPDPSTNPLVGKCAFLDLTGPISGKSVPLPDRQKNKLYIAALVLCRDKSVNVTLRVKGEARWLNPDLKHPNLGWEEVQFPHLALAALCLYAFEALLFLSYPFIARLRGLKIPLLGILVLNAAALFKALHAGLTYAYFSSVASTGKRGQWYLYSRLSVVSIADIAFICVAAAMSSGYYVLPEDWFVDARSPIFSVYVGTTFQILIIITVKLMSPFRYVSIVTYVLAAGIIGMVMVLTSYRNYHFMRRYGTLIEQAHIYVKTTPIPRMKWFYCLNICIVFPAYLFKIVSVGVWDYGFKRPDAFWGSLEIADAVLLLWYAVATFPSKKSALYVDLTNNSNERLHLAGAWRTSQGERTNPDTDGMAGATTVRRRVLTGPTTYLNTRRPVDREEGAISASNIEGVRLNPEPPWVEWLSGHTLPRPNAGTWGLHWPVTRILRRERKLVPVLPSNIVLGSPSESPNTLKLSVGVPTTGPRSVPKRFDEKGDEIAGSSFQNHQRGDAPSSLSLISRLARGVSGIEQDSASDLAGVSRGMLRRFGPNNRTPRTNSHTEAQTQGNDVGSTILDMSGTYSRGQSQNDYSQGLPSVASSSGSCDGILIRQDEIQEEDQASN